MTTKGIDISYCQRGVDYKKVKNSGVEFAIIRTGYLQKTDDMLHTHVNGCESAGIKYGFYVYALSQSPEEAIKEAQYCLDLIKNYKPLYPVYYDLEDARLEKLSKEQITEIALAFLGEIKKADYWPGIYANPAWLENHIDKTRLAEYDLWLAAWTENPEKNTKYDYGQKMWQWGLDNIDGVGKVDGNLCYVDYPDLITKGGYNKTALPEDYLSFAQVDKAFKCIGKAVKLRKYPSENAAILRTLEKNKTYKVSAEIFKDNKLKWLEIDGGYSMYIDQLNDKLFEEISQKNAAEETEFNVGDFVEITGAYAGASSVKTASNRAAIGGKRYIVRIIKGANYPYQLGVKKGDVSSNNTTGYADKKTIKLIG